MKNDSQLKNDANRGPYANVPKDKTPETEKCVSRYSRINYKRNIYKTNVSLYAVAPEGRNARKGLRKKGLRKDEGSEAAGRCQPLLEWQKLQRLQLNFDFQPFDSSAGRAFTYINPGSPPPAPFPFCAAKDTRNSWKYFVVLAIVGNPFSRSR